MRKSDDSAAGTGAINIDGRLLAQFDEVLRERNLGPASRFAAELVVDFLRRIAAPGFDRDDVTGVVTKYEFMNRLKTAFSQRRNPSTEVIGCFRAEVTGAPIDRDAALRSFAQGLQKQHGSVTVARWDNSDFVVWPFNKIDSDRELRYAVLELGVEAAGSPKVSADWLSLCIQTALNAAISGGRRLRASDPRTVVRQDE